MCRGGKATHNRQENLDLRKLTSLNIHLPGAKVTLLGTLTADNPPRYRHGLLAGSGRNPDAALLAGLTLATVHHGLDRAGMLLLGSVILFPAGL